MEIVIGIIIILLLLFIAGALSRVQDRIEKHHSEKTELMAHILQKLQERR